MRVLLVLGLLTAACLAACADDAIPSAAPSARLQQQDEQEAQQEQIADSQAQPKPTLGSDQQEADEDADIEQPQVERNRSLILRLTDETDVYPYPADDLHRPDSIGGGALLLADGWLALEDGRVWLRLDMNGDRVGWIRLVDSPLTLTEAQSLPQLDAPPLPTLWVRSTHPEPTEVRVLGGSEDGRFLAVRLVGRETVVWLARSELGSNADFDGLPTYAGPVAGAWTPRAFAPPAVAALVSGWRAQLSAWPNGPRIPFRLLSGEYPTLGRSLDSQWIAVRLEGLDPPIGWVPGEAVDLNVDVEELPMFLSAGLEIIELDGEGRARSSMLTAPPDLWEWRTDDELLIRTRSDEQWLSETWNPWSGTRQLVAGISVGDVSPDGRYAAHSEWVSSLEDRGGDVVLIPLDGGDWVRFDNVFKAIPRDGGWPDTYWSPDSQWRLTVLYSYDSETPTRSFALGIDGRRIEIIGPNWTETWQDIVARDSELTFLDEEGRQIEAPWSADRLRALAPHWKPLPSLGDGWWDAKWSPDGRLVLATRIHESGEFSEDGLATLPGNLWPGWGYVEIGVFNPDGQLKQVFRGYGWQCGSTRPRASWSPNGERIAIGPGWVGCQ